MNPVFRALTRCNRGLDAAIYDTFPNGQSEGAASAWILLLLSAGYLCVQLFVWNFASMQMWNWVLTILSVFVLIGSLCALHDHSHRRDRHLAACDAKRQEKAGAGELLTAVLFYNDFLVQYSMFSGTSERVEYEEIKEIRASERYIFLLLKKDNTMISLEKAGIAGKTPYEAMKWLAARIGCKLPK